MVSSDNTYAQFHGLEQLTKSGLVAYMFLLIAGGFIAGIGTDQLVRSLSGLNICAYILIGVGIRDCFIILIRGVNRIDWLGKLHLWIDRRLFGFAARSNKIIFNGFIVLLDPPERTRMEQLPDQRKNAIADTVISKLAEDQSIFESLMQRGMFRSWIWYWIAIYGVMVFVLLSSFSLTKMLMVPTIYTKALFISIASVTVLHLVACMVFGYNIILVTKKITREFGQYFRTEIVAILREQGS